MNQRAISNDVLEVVLSLRNFESAKGGAEKIFFGKKQSREAISELKRLIHIFEKAKNANIIIADGKIITTYKSR
jgi:hypothetical protein